MPILIRAQVYTVPRSVPPKAVIRFRLLRDGEVTAGVKHLRIFRDWTSVSVVCMAFSSIDGEFTKGIEIDLATLVDQGQWLVGGVDYAAPSKTRAVYMSFSESGTYTLNLTQGDGGAAGSPATVSAVVRVDQMPADREVVVLEKPSDGKWRVAGFGAAVYGELNLELRVTDGSFYALGLDDFGIAFAPSLVVSTGQTIRPSQFTGWLYRITEAGTLPATEPAWWPAEGDNASRLLGTARAIAVRYYQPLAHGPLPVELL